MTDEEYLKKMMDRLNQNSHYGIMIDTEITKIVRNHIEKEDNEMKATSVQNIKNVRDICISAASFPMGGPGETLTIVIYTDDDVFEFNFEGADLVQKCKKSGLFSGWEKEQKIRKLVEEYNAAETLYNNDLIDDMVYDDVNHKILRTIIAHFAMGLNKEDTKDE